MVAILLWDIVAAVVLAKKERIAVVAPVAVWRHKYSRRPQRPAIVVAAV
jgi:hypothetical protein